MRTRVELAGAFVDGHHAAHMQRGVALVVVSGEDLELGMQHGEFSGWAVELHLAEQGDAHARRELVGQVAAVEPLGHQDGARRIREAGFEQFQAVPIESAHPGREHAADDRGHLSWGKLRDGLHVSAVFVSEWDVTEQVLDSRQACRPQLGR